ncbi:FAD-dependent oxidoreductase [Jatrophihabitans cynanchi]|jgi:3-phenylpropionate/trans-cinnamate dioxygenase ferredoxin reductase subunit|uniref:FAD-dependent oxidoreductase n=1 Tax=Jatrophihabitans cynanchi TaxID=2944128 RepID=A0ABY7K2Y7_9ACTN|nr:FAD-dependent oxidoreductase [Jatrophihabitans sp. SB3-54]WAX58258.1 FAD-dependent oxidoreductase [Jatrophihabitans sp. SB3-54]
MTTYAIIGAGQTAAVAARTLRRRGFDGRIELIGAEPHPPYQRPPLTKEYLAAGPDGSDDELFLLDEQWCAANDVHLRLGQRAVRIRPAEWAVDLADGTQVRADKVLVATGGAARKLPGVRGERVHYLRTLDDANTLRRLIGPGVRLIVIGAGFIGSEVAATAHCKGAEVTVIDTLDAPLQRILGRELGAVCATIHRSNGVTVRLGEPVESVVEHEDAVIVKTGRARLEGDLVVVGVGITPNIEVAQRSGVTVDNGILVDEYCRTNVPNIFAAGDVANHYHPLFDELIRVEHFDNATKHGAAAANNMLGNATIFDDPHWFWSDQYELNIQHTGHARGWDELVIRGSVDELDFCAFYLRESRVRAAFAVDRGADIAIAKELISGRVHVAAHRLKDEDVDLADLLETEQAW